MTKTAAEICSVKKSMFSILSKNNLNNSQKMVVVEKSAELILNLLENRFEPKIDDVSFNIIISFNPESSNK